MILDNRAEYPPRFVKLMPVEYRRVLEQLAEQCVRLTKLRRNPYIHDYQTRTDPGIHLGVDTINRAIPGKDQPDIA